MVQLWRATGTPALVPVTRPVQASARGLVEFCAFSPDGRLLATSGDDGTIRLWSLSSPARPRLLATMHDSGSYVFSVAFSPDGAVLAAASADNLTRLWDIARPARPHPGSAGRWRARPVTPSRSRSARTVPCWRSAARTRPSGCGMSPTRPGPSAWGPLTGPAGYVYSVAFSPDGHTLAAGATDGTTWLWQVSHPGRAAPLAELTGPAHQVYSVAFSPSGRTLAAGSADGTVRLWDTAVRAAAARGVRHGGAATHPRRMGHLPAWLGLSPSVPRLTQGQG